MLAGDEIMLLVIACLAAMGLVFSYSAFLMRISDPLTGPRECLPPLGYGCLCLLVLFTSMSYV